MMRYTQICPVIFGEGIIRELGNEAKKLGISAAAVITDAVIMKTDGYKMCVKSLKESGIDVVEFAGCVSDPPSDIVEQASRIAKEGIADGVIGIGGGSNLDTAKGVNVLLNNPEPLTQYFGNPAKNSGYPLICIPTTAGTGSEVTAIGVITNKETGVKGPAVYSPASLAVLDPLMTVTAPPAVTAMAGMDAFSHAAETLTSKLSNPRSDVLAIEAVRLIFNALPRAVADGSDIKARTDMLIGSNLAGIAFADSKVHLGHAMAAAIGEKFHLPHGICCALSISQTMKYAATVKPERVKIIGDTIGIGFAGNESSKQIGDMVSGECLKLIKKIHIPSFMELGISRDDILGVAGLVMGDICFTFAPAAISKDEVIRYLGAAYDEYM